MCVLMLEVVLLDHRQQQLLLKLLQVQNTYHYNHPWLGHQHVGKEWFHFNVPIMDGSLISTEDESRQHN
jgi:hypothetical protein